MRIGLTVVLLSAAIIMTVGAGHTVTVSERATMKRVHDPIQAPGELLAGLRGEPLKNMRLFSRRSGGMSQIICQFDERTPTGTFTFDLGIAKNVDKANGILDPQDLLVFRISDSGDRVPVSEWPSKKGVEIELEDPIDGGKSYVYLIYFDDNPPELLKKETISLKYWDPWKRPDMPFIVQGYSYTIEGFVNKIGSRYYKTAINRSFSVPPEAGGTGVNFLDTMKLRVFVELFFGKARLEFNENNVIGGIEAIKQGNVRGYGRQWMTLALPLGLRGIKVHNDVFTYDRMVVAPMNLNIPVDPKKLITKAGIEYGYDFNEAAYGMKFYSPTCPDGALIDGKMSDKERVLPKTWDPWWLVTGPQGTLLFRAHIEPEFLKQIKATTEFIDDTGVEFPPEGLKGSIGYARNLVELTSIQPGVYGARIEWYFPPHFYKKEGGYDRKMLQEFFNIIDNPVIIRVAGKTAKNIALTPPRLIAQKK